MPSHEQQLPSRGAARNRRRIVLWVGIPLGMIFGAALQNLARVLLPSGVVKQIFTSGLTWQSGPRIQLDLLVGSLSLGPAAVDISLLSVIVVFLTVRALLFIFE
ncbi:MAG TPA: hypothetical protein VFK16_08630 [Gemmatimonadaceae bacterium]|jgi:hypothetical protein|nr:hypothetical protein [Gemmatimonadaceae bacterium]